MTTTYVGNTGLVDDFRDLVLTGPDTLGGKMLRRFWHPVVYSHELEAGRAMPLTHLNEQFTLYRGESGKPHIVGFNCPHRKTQLSVGWVEGEDVRCFYHGWMFNGRGECVAQPAEPQPFCEKVRIPAYHAEEYLGMIFVYVGEGEPPPLPRYPEFEYPDRIEATEESFVRGCNWFQGVENGTDQVHGLFVHARGERDGRLKKFPLPDWEEHDWGVYAARDGKTGGGIFFPNLHPFSKTIDDLSIDLGGPLPTLVWEIPVDDYTHRQIGVQRLPRPKDDPLIREYHANRAERYARYEPVAPISAAVLEGRMHREDVGLNRTHTFTFEDDLAQVGQGAIEDRRGERLGRSDTGIIAVRKIWRRELNKLATGQALTTFQWTAPESWDTMQPVAESAVPNSQQLVEVSG